MRRIALLALLLPTAACSTWPEAVGGGMAELACSPAPPALAASATAHHLDCSLQQFARLAGVSQQSGRATGRVLVLREDAARAQREVAGQLLADADLTLTRLDHDMNALGLELHGAARTREQCAA